MKEYYGKKIFGGIAIGKISFYLKNQNVVVRKKTDDSDGEIARYEEAREKAIAKSEANSLSRYIVNALQERRERKNTDGDEK